MSRRRKGAEEWFKKLTAFFDQPQVMVLKKTKKGEKEMDLKPLIYDLGVIAGNDAAQSQLFMKISTGSASNIKPELFVGAYYEHWQGTFSLCLYGSERRSIRRSGIRA